MLLLIEWFIFAVSEKIAFIAMKIWNCFTISKFTTYN